MGSLREDEKDTSAGMNFSYVMEGPTCAPKGEKNAKKTEVRTNVLIDCTV